MVRRIYHALKLKVFMLTISVYNGLCILTDYWENVQKKRYHSYKGNVGRIADNIIDRNLQRQHPFRSGTTDVSQFNFPWGKCYISPILDMFTNEIISMIYH